MATGRSNAFQIKSGKCNQAWKDRKDLEEDYPEASGTSEIQANQLQYLSKSLATMRTVEKSDVLIECGGREFYAHKVILEANTPYFTTMFQSNLEEAKTGKIIFQDMEPDTLDAILDFLYLADVQKISTDIQFMNVLKASHMLELQNLFQYCCNYLPKILSPKNFLEFWNLAEKYGDESLLEKVKIFFQNNTFMILTFSIEFLNATASQFKDLVMLFKSKNRNLDIMLKAIIHWGLHDLPNRENFSEELFTYIDANHVSEQFAMSLLHDSKLTTLSTKLANRLIDLITEICFAEDGECRVEKANILQLQIGTTNLQFAYHKLFFFMQEKADDTISETDISLDNFASYIQLFDLKSMSWQPKHQLPCVNFKVDAICQYKEYVFMIGSTGGNFYILYDLSNNTLEYVKTNNNLSTPSKSACYFKDTVYLVGGNVMEKCTAVNLEEQHMEWFKTSPLNICHTNPVLFTSEDYMFVVGGTSIPSQQVVEYTDGDKNWIHNEEYDQMTWTVAELPNDLIHSDVHFFSYNNQLCGLCSFNDTLVKLTYKNKNWKCSQIHTEMIVKDICHFQIQTNCPLLVLTTDAKDFIPTSFLEIESFNCSRLPKPNGKCEIKKGRNVLSTSCYLPQRN